MLSKKWMGFADVLIIVALACVPLFLKFPFRVNIFLSWEGAYRLSQGQMPYRDFGIPMGYMYWVVPAMFFKVFGPQMLSLVKAQVFLNILSGLAFSSILRSFRVDPVVRVSSVLLFCVSYSFSNFWPWYNHSVIVYELVALAFLCRYLMVEPRRWAILLLAALFTVVTFFTKQDAGALTVILCLVLLGTHGLYTRTWTSLLVYVGGLAAIAFFFWFPFRNHDMGYWFNLGQPPHTARVSIAEILDNFFGHSEMLKFYLMLMLILFFRRVNREGFGWIDRREALFGLLVLGILAEAVIFEVTSYTPPGNNIFFHSFAVAYLLRALVAADVAKKSFYALSTLAVFVLFWWSGVFWKYVQRIARGRLSVESSVKVSPTGENIVNKNTYMIRPPDTSIPESEWVFSDRPSLRGIYLPKPTVEGMERVLAMPEVKGRDRKVLNMSELTVLAAEAPFKLETGSRLPLWYHLGVGMFNREADLFEDRIRKNYYDAVLFEYIPGLNNFYPFRVRDVLRQQYRMVDSFYAPRRGEETKGMIEVYVPRTSLDTGAAGPSNAK